MIRMLTRTEGVLDNEGNPRQWIVKIKNDKIKEIKMIYEVNKYKGEYAIMDDSQLIKFLKTWKQ
mgnify:FL=1|tara:strand:+ start:1221 stop:1412 length:192 start_codon:yes stop_codon:yes gene_type:complete